MNESTMRHYSTADRKAEAVAEVEQMVKGGTRVRAAVEAVAYRTGISERTLFTCLNKTKGIVPEKRADALARKPQKNRPKVICHPAAVKRFIELASQGLWVTKCYRQVTEEAKANGWGALPSERTLRRQLDRQVSSNERWMARRGEKPEGEA